ncbi:hypothetical protein [Rhodovulum sp. MB263]|uniref:hypothetical protein n=1 Tax=Rhodovulum sp. (strain MB263) TaxID=308754 RepID=UPI0009B7BF0F|nr:hypothetical protein [Rhodovulum sp. MB263]ARC90357.1 hypothetical protein B5V46_18015 [Rhodovulum sp. MB263]
MPISAETARDIALAHREILTAEELLKKIEDTRSRHSVPDIRDAFGRLQSGLQLGVPSGEGSFRLFNVPWSMCRPIIEAHIAQQRALIEALSEKAMIEMKPRPVDVQEA